MSFTTHWAGFGKNSGRKAEKTSYTTNPRNLRGFFIPREAYVKTGYSINV